MNSSTSETSDIPAKGKKLLPVAGALCFPAMILLKMGFFFLVIGRVRQSRKYIIGIVASLNFAGVFPELFVIMLQGGTLRAVLDGLSDPRVWASMYGAAALGWFIVWLSPSIARRFLETVYRSRMRHMEYLQKELEEEWGPEVKGSE
jgi:hypothetical protein